MLFPTILPRSVHVGRSIAALMLLPCVIAAASDPDVAIYARAYNGYARTRLADNSFKPETYTFAEGGRFGGIPGDKSLESLTFHSVVRTLAGPLRKRGYVPSFDVKNTDFIILVFWGMTSGAEGGRYTQGEQGLKDAMQGFASRPGARFGAETPAALSTEANQNSAAAAEMDQAMAMQSLINVERDQNNFSNAGILGYREELQRASDIPWFGFSKDIIAEIESDRYFVVLKAYDFRTLLQTKRWKVIWELRYSIPARGISFDEKLAEMTKRASKYFGNDVRHLIREEVKEGKVEVGTPTVVEMDKK